MFPKFIPIETEHLSYVPHLFIPPAAARGSRWLGKNDAMQHQWLQAAEPGAEMHAEMQKALMVH